MESSRQTLTYVVPDMSCSHCEAAIIKEVSVVPGVSSVDVNLEGKLVEVHGVVVEDAAVRAAIDHAGYEVAE